MMRSNHLAILCGTLVLGMGLSACGSAEGEFCGDAFDTSGRKECTPSSGDLSHGFEK